MAGGIHGAPTIAVYSTAGKSYSECGTSVAVFENSDQDLYQTLGLQRSASGDEIRRAYRILARRYHPDVNPGSHSAERFTAISEAYETLSDETKRSAYDAELQTAFHFSEAAKRAQAYAANQAAGANAKSQRPASTKTEAKSGSARSKHRSESATPKAAVSLWSRVKSVGENFIPRKQRSLAVVEVSLSMREAILGGKKSIELQSDGGERDRKISLNVPAASRNGSILQLRSRRENGEEVLVIFRVAPHPFVSVESRGIIIELALSVSEAVNGATLIVPTFDEPVALKIPAFTSSGQEFRLRGKGVGNAKGERGDLFFRAQIKLPEDQATRERLISETKTFSKDGNLRNYLPSSFNELR